MEDSQIIDLYWRRDENAIVQTDKKYGVFCHKLAMNILSLHEDAEECVNDTYHQAWNAMPPQRPSGLKAWLGRVVRNISINLWKKNHAQKRYSGLNQILSELEDCIPATSTVEDEIAAKELSKHINRWLAALPEDDRILFMRRYWHGYPLNTLARECGILPRRLAQRMYRLRLSLKKALEKEDVVL